MLNRDTIKQSIFFFSPMLILFFSPTFDPKETHETPESRRQHASTIVFFFRPPAKSSQRANNLLETVFRCIQCLSSPVESSQNGHFSLSVLLTIMVSRLIAPTSAMAAETIL